MRISILFVMVVAACAGDEVDPGNGQVCTKALYDECLTEHDCMSNQCHTFSGEGFTVCTQGCTAAVPCPDQAGVAVECNNMGLCKPPAATECRILNPGP